MKASIGAVVAAASNSLHLRSTTGGLIMIHAAAGRITVNGIQGFLRGGSYFLVGLVSPRWIGRSSELQGILNGRDSIGILSQHALELPSRHRTDRRLADHLQALVLDVGIGLVAQTGRQILSNVLTSDGAACCIFGNVQIQITRSWSVGAFRCSV